MNGREIIKRLKAEGWQVVRTRGSHHLLARGGKTIPVPVHGKKDIGIGLLKAIEKQTGVKLR